MPAASRTPACDEVGPGRAGRQQGRCRKALRPPRQELASHPESVVDRVAGQVRQISAAKTQGVALLLVVLARPVGRRMIGRVEARCRLSPRSLLPPGEGLGDMAVRRIGPIRTGWLLPGSKLCRGRRCPESQAEHAQHRHRAQNRPIGIRDHGLVRSKACLEEAVSKRFVL